MSRHRYANTGGPLCRKRRQILQGQPNMQIQQRMSGAYRHSGDAYHFVAVHFTPFSTGQLVCKEKWSWVLSGFRL